MKHSTNPILVSIIIPVHNGAELIQDALNSIHAQKYIDPTQLEIIVIDDHSTDNTVNIVKANSPAAQLLSCQENNPGKVRNHGLLKARGKFIAFLDHDDLWPEDKLFHQLNLFQTHPNADIILGKIQYQALPGHVVPPMRFPYPDNCIYHVHLGASLFKKTVFETIGYFDPNLRFSEDIDLFMRARENALNLIQSEPIALIYRLHSNNMTRDLDSSGLQLNTALRQSLKRRQAHNRQLSPWQK